MSYPKPFLYWTTYAGHGGFDYPRPSGTPILAIADGYITYSGWWNNNAGWTRTLTTTDGIQSVNCHLVNLGGPPVGSFVRAGEVMAYVGTTGHSTGNHLHHEIYVRGVKQTGDNYWKYIDKNRVITPSGSGGGGVTPPTPQPLPIPKKDKMIAYYVTDDVDGNRIGDKLNPGWAYLSESTGRIWAFVNDGSVAAQNSANDLALTFGTAKVVKRQTMLNAQAVILNTL